MLVFSSSRGVCVADLGFQENLHKTFATMKLVTLVCLLIFSVATESRHLQKRDHEHHPRHISDIVKQVGKSTVEKLLLVMVAQNFQKCSLDEHLKLRAKILEVVDHCIEHPEEADCKKPGMTLYHDIVCKAAEVEEIYPWTKECCPKEESERNKCFMDHSDAKVEEYKIPNIEEACKEHKEHPEYVFSYYLSNVAKLHPRLHPPAILGFAIQYNQITTECCAAEDKPKCFHERMPQVKKLTNYIENKQKQKCHILASFPEITFKALTRVQIAQKFGKAEYESVEKLTSEIVHLNKDCCKGDSVECMLERMEVTDHICKDKDKLSSSLGACCDKDLLERTPCVLALPNEDSGLPKEMKEYYEGEHVCLDYEKDKTIYLAHFAYEYARRHPDSSPQSVLRVAKGYEGLAETCCAGQNQAECLKQAPNLLEAALKEVEELTKQNCDGLKALGFKDFYLMLTIRYFAKMPQVTSPTLVEITGKMAKSGEYCCALPENKVQACAEEKLDMLLGEMCEREKETFVNEDVHRCCITSYADRRPCITKLGPDANYVAPAWDETKLHFTPALCDGSAEQQLQKKMVLLIEFMKMKPNCGKEKVKEAVEAFRKTTDECCAAEDRQACFDREKKGLLELIH